MRSFILYVLFHFCILIFLSGYSYTLNAQAYDFRSLTVSEGLPHGQITDIVQRSNGYVWIGTAASGVARFDGLSYQIFDASTGLKDDMITTLFEDSEENLWIATYSGGVALLQGTRFIYPFKDHPLDDAYVISILEAPDGKIWFSTYEDGIFIYNGESLEQISEDDGLISNIIWDVFWDEDGTIWVATHNGISVIDGATFRNYDIGSGISGNKVFKIIEKNGVKWLATNRGITKIDGDTFSTISEIDGRQLNYVYDMIKASDGRIWIGMENDGVFRYVDGNFTHISRTEGLVSNYIYRLYEDNNQNVWIATDERGISIFRNEKFRFFNTGNGLINNEVLSLLKDDDKIWIGTVNGLQSYQGNTFQNYIIPDDLSEEKYIWDIEKLPNGDLFLLMDDNRLLGFDGKKYVDYSEKLGIEAWIFDLKSDSEGLLWFGSEEGLIQYDGKELEFYGIEDGLPGSVVYHIFESREGDIWVSTNVGAARFDGETFHTISYDDGLGHYNVNYITQDSYGDFWIGTSAGITHYKPARNGEPASLQNFGKQDGMKLVETLFLWFDDDDQLWQGTNGGLHQLNVAQYRINGVMDIEHHRLSNHGIGVEAMHKAKIRDDIGRGWFGTMNGILIIDPQKSTTKSSVLPVILDELLLNGSKVSLGDSNSSFLNNNGQIQLTVDLPYGNNTISFSYVALEYLHPEKTAFSYKLEGFDDNWSKPSESNTATYTNLDSGNYRFLVQAKNGGGQWNTESAGYSFSVAKPFWQTYWFWTLMITGAGISVTGFIRVRLNYLEKVKLSGLVDEQTRTLREALDEKEVLIKEVHHRVKNNLAVIYSLLELQSGYIEDEVTLSVFRESKLRVQSIALIHEKVYQNESLSRIEANKYIPELVEVIVKTIENYEKTIELQLNVEDVSLSIDQGIPCGLIINELVTNAYKHAFCERNNGNLTIDFHQKNGKMMMKVSDNGRGLPENFKIGESDSLGLILVNTLSAQLRADMNIQSNGAGCSFEFEFEKDNK